MWKAKLLVSKSLPSPGPPVPSGQLRQPSPGRWWLLRWTWQLPVSVPQSSRTHPPPAKETEVAERDAELRGGQGSRHSERRGGEGSKADLGFGPGLQLLQLLGCSLNGSRSSQEFILSDDCGVLWVHPFCSWWTKRGGKGLRQSREIRSSGQHAYCPQALASVKTLRMPSLSSLLEAELSPEQGFPFPACPWSPLTLHGLSSLDELSD